MIRDDRDDDGEKDDKGDKGDDVDDKSAWGHLSETQSGCFPIARPATHGPQRSSPNKV